MEIFVKKATKYTPHIELNPESGIFNITGKSYPENTFEFYKPVVQWVEEYFQNPQEQTVINMEIIYFNSSSSKFFFDMFDKLEEKAEDGHQIIINWIYDEDNDVAEEAGEDFQEDFEALTINLIAKD